MNYNHNSLLLQMELYLQNKQIVCRKPNSFCTNEKSVYIRNPNIFAVMKELARELNET